MERSLSTWMLWHAVVMTMLSCVSIAGESLWPVVCGMVLSVIIFITWQYRTWSQIKPLGGYANHITLLRLLILLVAVVLIDSMHMYVFTALIVVVMIADGIDGYLARRFDSASDFGEVFDTEVDAFLALSLAILIATTHPNAIWVLVGGLMRYVMIILYRVLGWHRRRRPHMPEAKTFAIIYFIALLTPWILEWSIAIWLVLVGTLLVTYSFAKEFVSVRNV